MSNHQHLHVVKHHPAACDECRLRAHCMPDHLEGEVAAYVTSRLRPLAPVPRGTYLFRQGAPMTSYYFVRSGSAKSVVFEHGGRESVMGFLFPSDLVGTASLHQETYQDAVVTLERSSFCELRASDLHALLSRDTPALEQFLDKIVNRIATERHARVRLEHSSADERVADFLLELSARFGVLGRDPQALYLTMSRYDIANYVGLAPETVSRVLRRFSDRDLIAVRHKEVGLRDLASLRDISLGENQATTS
ncbi:MAG: Crp/Fnr family transcriptional regulator [Gammaproteobacteria bacterium]